jgi:hypothetical protein
MAHDPTNTDIMRELGGLVAENEHAKDSRRVIHEKLDEFARLHLETVRSIGELQRATETTTMIATQARDVANAGLQNINRFEREFREVQLPIISAAQAFRIEAEPLLATMKIVRTIVVTLAGLTVTSLGTLVVMAIWAREQLGIALRFILGI